MEQTKGRVGGTAGLCELEQVYWYRLGSLSDEQVVLEADGTQGE